MTPEAARSYLALMIKLGNDLTVDEMILAMMLVINDKLDSLALNAPKLENAS